MQAPLCRGMTVLTAAGGVLLSARLLGAPCRVNTVGWNLISKTQIFTLNTRTGPGTALLVPNPQIFLQPPEQRAKPRTTPREPTCALISGRPCCPTQTAVRRPSALAHGCRELRGSHGPFSGSSTQPADSAVN